jgi:hypothetical protein
MFDRYMFALRPKHQSWSHYFDASEPVAGYSAQNMAIVEFGI